MKTTKNKIQVLLIHGGTTFKSDKDYLHYLKTRKITTEKRVSWTGDYLEKSLGKKFEIISPRMPLREFAKYRDWKIHFERYLSLIKNKYILLGTSLGGVFLAKYLSENKLRKKALSVYLICPPFDNTLPEEDLVGGFKLEKDLSLIEKNCQNLHLLFSQDDNVVPVSHAEKYRQKLKNAHIVIYKSKGGHFRITKFPEIVKLIFADVNYRC
ncbi:MAG: alpha/beta hydrolase [Patescibacteria group bacterium]|jgi:predicted alpha/beta hydrolase family esterase|nr:alpha/beta hydrolase [bacterium]